MRLFETIFQNPKPLYTSLNPLCAAASHPQLLAATQAADGSGERVVNSGEELDDIFVGHA